LLLKQTGPVNMAIIQGAKRLNRTLKELRTRYDAHRIKDVLVGYTANYAIFVHENLEAAHKPGKIAKFLETPFRENQSRYAKIIATALKRGSTVTEALKLAGLALQRDSQAVVPVDTGNLKGSAFCREDKELF